MATKLVIVESPAKAKTIAGYLGSDYQVEASIGHIRDLPLNGRALPAAEKKRLGRYADFAVDIDAGFEPIYEVPKEKQRQVDKLKAAMKGKDTLILATDEDREGESISWHLLQVLKPPKGMKIMRIAFHEITRDAIRKALEHPRDIDGSLVEAQETRRILDRLYGYSLSPVLWSKVVKDLSAGRVQSPAVKLIVDREKERKRFVRSVYWDLKATLSKDKTDFEAMLESIEGKRLATGKDFDETTGKLAKEAFLLLQEIEAKDLAEATRAAEPWRVAEVETEPGIEKQPEPFRTTTLQQDANRKFRLSAQRTMRIAQDLYEGIEIDGQSTGLITYMRTDSLNLADTAVAAIRAKIEREFGSKYLPAKPFKYASKVANAQEAHEAIRPTDMALEPAKIQRALLGRSKDHFELYKLIYERSMACQMKPAEVERTRVLTNVTVQGKSLGFRSSGKVYTFDGFRRAYTMGHEDEIEKAAADERRLPRLAVGDQPTCKEVEAARHETRPPSRYTDATLIRELEKHGIGRPSTYASILGVIEDRGYVRKKGRELIPMAVAFLAMEVLEGHFPEFMNLEFTARMDQALDDVANGHTDSKVYLKEFFFGEGADRPGLKVAVEERKAHIPFPNLPIGTLPSTGEPVVVRVNQDGKAFAQVGEGDNRRFANVPPEATYEEVTPEYVEQLLSEKKSDGEAIGFHPESGRRLLLKHRTGYYLEVERTEEEIKAKVKPTWVSLPQDVDPRSLSQDDLNELCALPKPVGADPETGEVIVFGLGRSGPYLKKGSDYRNLGTWREGLTITPEEVNALFAQPKTFGRSQGVAKGPIQEFNVEGFEKPIRILAGRFGPYATDGTVNATLPRGTDPATIGVEQVVELILKKREQGPPPAKRGRKPARAGGKAAGRKK